MKKRFLSLALAVGLLLSNNVIASASTITVTEPGTEEVTVIFNVASDWSVTIPKTIEMDSSTKSATYEVSVAGDIADDEYISVVPDADFEMVKVGGGSVTANITQDKTEWRTEDFSVDGNGSIVIEEDMPAGEYSGTYNFTISLETE